MSNYRDPDLVRALVRQGYTPESIAERAGVTSDAVRRLVNGSGPRSREQSRASPSGRLPPSPEEAD